MTLATLSAFFGWMAILNIGFLLLATLAAMFMRPLAYRIHRKIFDISEADIDLEYYRFLAHYKILGLITSVIPWLALQMM